MPAGDVTDLLTAKVRIILNEATAGFWTDAQIISVLSNAQRKAILIMLGKKKEMEKYNPEYIPSGLEPCIKKATAITTSTANNYSLSAITDLIEIVDVEMINASPERSLRTNYMPYPKQLLYMRNSYTTHTYDTTTKTGTVYSSVYGTTLQLSFPTDGFPNLDYAQIIVTYIYNPPELSTDIDPVLKADCYDAMIYMAVSDALAKDGLRLEAQQYYQLAITLLI